VRRRAAGPRRPGSGPATARTALRALSLAALLVAGVLSLSAPAAAASGGERVKSGTGFFVSRNGLVVTSAHVVADCHYITIWQPDGTAHPAYLIAADPRADVALLWARGSVVRRAAFAARRAPRAGETVFTLGFGVAPTEPLRSVIARGSFVGSSMAQRGNRILVIRARLHAGNSGGAVLAGDGSLLGMVIGRDEQRPDFGVAIPDRDIAALLAAYRIGLPPGGGGEDAEHQLSAISVLIQCTAAADAAAAELRSSFGAQERRRPR
jgi:S1-C subfamily serine protease